MGFPDSPSGGVLGGFYGGAVGLGGGELQLTLKALFQPLASLGVCCRTVLNPTLSSFRPPVLPCE